MIDSISESMRDCDLAKITEISLEFAKTKENKFTEKNQSRNSAAKRID